MTPEAADWQEMAGKLARRFPRERLHAGVLGVLTEQGVGAIGIACSGGADSMALLLLAYAHFPEHRPRFVVLHFNHATRGRESDADEALVREAALGLRLGFHSARRRDAAGTSEQHLRDARMGFLHDTLCGLGGDRLLFGHHRDDVVETLLMRLTRGSGAAGLAAPRPVHRHANGVRHLRLLLPLGKDELIGAMTEVGVPWREDASNASSDHFRNRLRAAVIPALRESAPADAAANMLLTRRLLEEEDAALDCWLAQTLPASGAVCGPLDVTPLRGKPAALWRRALRLWLSANGLGKAFSRSGFESLLEEAMSKTTFRVSAGQQAFVRLREGHLEVFERAPMAPRWPSVCFVPGCAVAWPDGSWVQTRLVPWDEGLSARVLGGAVDNAHEVFLALPAGGEAVLEARQVRPGDRYTPLGAPGSRKLQDIFVDKRIPLLERGMVPIVCVAGGEILWRPGLPPAEGARLENHVREALELTYLRA